MNRAWSRLTVLAASLTLLATGLIAGSQVAQAANRSISSSGPLTNIWISDTLGCQVAYQGDMSYEWYNPGSQETSANCGTRLYVPDGGSGIVFGPASNYTIDQVWTPVSQSAVTGAGTSDDPYKIVTVVKAVDSNGPTDLGIQLTQTDTYVVGEASYRTDVRIDNTSGAAFDGVLYRLGDCYLQGSDSGYGIHDTISGSVGCRASQDAGARVEEWVPITSGSHYYESGYYNVVAWPTGDNGISGARGTNFPNSSDDSTSQDNGTGISWSVSVPAGGHQTFSELSAFSPTGNVPLSTSKTADQDTAAPGAQDGYTITVHNPNVNEVTLNDVTDNLPNGFSYVSGSTTNASDDSAIDDPTNDSGGLTWSGPFTVPAGGDFSLHFNADVANATGNYNNQAGADAAGGYSVAPTGPTAQVQVTETGGSIDADLQIAKSDAAPNGPDPVTAGNDVSYQIDVTNNGPDDSTGVAVTDDLPPGTSFVSATGNGWTCDFDSESRTVFCSRAGLVNGATRSIDVVLQAPDPAPDGCQANGDLASCITDSATVDFSGPDDQFDPNTDNNTATETTEVQPRPQNPDQSTGFVPPEGGKVTTGNNPTATDNTDATVKLPPGPGGVVNIQEETPPDNFCGGQDCSGQAVLIQIPDGYNDPNSPPKAVLKYDTTVVRPRGGAKIYIQKGSETPVLVPQCLQHGVANPSPCVGSRQRLPNGDLRVTILLLSGDPLTAKH